MVRDCVVGIYDLFWKGEKLFVGERETTTTEWSQGVGVCNTNYNIDRFSKIRIAGRVCTYSHYYKFTWRESTSVLLERSGCHDGIVPCAPAWPSPDIAQDFVEPERKRMTSIDAFFCRSTDTSENSNDIPKTHIIRSYFLKNIFPRVRSANACTEEVVNWVRTPTSLTRSGECKHSDGFFSICHKRIASVPTCRNTGKYIKSRWSGLKSNGNKITRNDTLGRFTQCVGSIFQGKKKQKSVCCYFKYRRSSGSCAVQCRFIFDVF